MYHNEVRNCQNGGLKLKQDTFEDPPQLLSPPNDTLLDNNIAEMGFNGASQGDEEYFGALEADDQPFSNQIAEDLQEDEEHKHTLQEVRAEVRRSKRRVARLSFAELNENGIGPLDNQDDDEYRLIKCNQYAGGTDEQPIQVYISFQ